MKLFDWTKILSAAILPIVLAGCAGTTPSPTTGDANIDDPAIDSTGVVGESMPGSGNDSSNGSNANLGTPETKKFTGQYEKGKWPAIHFDYDSASISSNDRSTLEEIAAYLKSHSSQQIRIEGHCDERGTREYNRSLGQRRASAAREYLIKLGVNASNIGTISYGEEQPAETGHNDNAWAQNRRDEFGLGQ